MGGMAKGGILGGLLNPATSIIGAVGGLGKDISGMLKPPTIPTPPTMPTIDSQAVADAQKQSLIKQMARRGRASTILTTPQSDKLG